MEYNKTTKFARFMKKYAYWLALGFSICLLATVLTLSVIYKSNINNDDPFVPVTVEEINFASPVASVSVIKDYSNSALQYSSTLRLWQTHKAMDFAAEEGTEVLAVLDGTITEVTYNYLMGNIVKLDVGNGMIVVYASLSSDIPVKQGDTVTKGSKIGYVSNTAKTEVSDGPHLHLEVLLDDEKVDPNLYLDLEEK